MFPNADLSALLIAGSLLFAPAPALHLKQESPPQAASDKITFDLSRLAPANGAAASIRYEFCIPEGDRYFADVLAIDPTIHRFPDSRGHIGCRRNQDLCVGTVRSEGRDVVLAIARLSYVERIDEFFGE